MEKWQSFQEWRLGKTLEPLTRHERQVEGVVLAGIVMVVLCVVLVAVWALS